MDYAPPAIDHAPEDEHKLWANTKKGKKMRGIDTLPRQPVAHMKSGGWIKKAINPAHKGFCTPMSKSTCTPRRKALAMRFKKGGDLHK
jgi:hypothetical protein